MQKEEKWVNDVANLLASAMQTELECYENRVHQKIHKIQMEILTQTQYSEKPTIIYNPADSKRNPEYEVWCKPEGNKVNIYFFEERMTAYNSGNNLKCCIKTNVSFEKIIAAFLEANIVY